MSVLTYIYPREPERLDMDSVLNSLECICDDFAAEECERKPRAIPNWTYLLLSLKSTKQVRYKLVVEQNSKSNIKWVSNRYPNSRNLRVVRDAKKYIWTQIIAGGATDRVFSEGIIVHDRIMWSLARLSKGVVDLPENERLYSSSGFARHVARTEQEINAFLNRG